MRKSHILPLQEKLLKAFVSFTSLAQPLTLQELQTTTLYFSRDAFNEACESALLQMLARNE